MKKQLLVALAAGFIGTSAMAQSAFEGFYAQAGIGYENNSIASRSYTFNSYKGASDSGSASGPSSSGGGFSSAIGLGYNMSVAPQWVVGLGADYTPTNTTTSTVAVAVCDGCGGSLNYKVKNRYSVYVTPGYEIDKDKLVYVKAGYTGESLVGQGQSGGASGSQSVNASGFVGGLGYKQLIDKNLYVFGEGNYYSYSSTTINGTASGGTFSLKQTPSAYQFLVGVGYKF
jgi:hypothetical protein